MFIDIRKQFILESYNFKNVIGIHDESRFGVQLQKFFAKRLTTPYVNSVALSLYVMLCHYVPYNFHLSLLPITMVYSSSIGKNSNRS